MAGPAQHAGPGHHRLLVLIETFKAMVLFSPMLPLQTRYSMPVLAATSTLVLDTTGCWS